MSRTSKRFSTMSYSGASPMESLEGRQMFTVTPAMPAAGVLTFVGDGANDTINLNDNGAGAISGSFTNFWGGLSFFGPIPGIQTIRVSTGAGNDYVNYQITGDMPAGSVRYVNVDLGAGDDVSRLYAGNDIDIAAGANFYYGVYGGSGKDYISTFYSGELDGQLRQTLSGGYDDDRIITNARLDLGSGGFFFNRTSGNEGDDTMDLLVRKVNPFDVVGVDAGASGGAHVFGDRLTRTPLAWNDATVEFLAVVP